MESSAAGASATKRRVVVTGKIDLQHSPAGRPAARASPQSYTYGSPVSGPSGLAPRSATATPTQGQAQPRARARVNVAALNGTPVAQMNGQDGTNRQSSAGGSTLGRRALVRSATTPNTVPGFRPESPGTPTAAAAARAASAISASSNRSDRTARSTLGGTIKARVNLASSQVSDTDTARAIRVASSPSIQSLSGPSSRPLLPSLPITPTSAASSSHESGSIIDGVSPRSTAREIARQARLGASRTGSNGSSATDLPFPGSASRETCARSPSMVSDRSSVSYRSSDVASSSAAGMRSPRLTNQSTPPTEVSSYGSLDREKQTFSLDQAMLGQQAPLSPPRQQIGDFGDAGQGPLSPGRSEIDEAAADAKRDRKIADLEISNKSLMTINRNLEAEAARKDRLIMSLKRQLRASAGIPGGSIGNPRHSSGRTSMTGAPAAEHDDEDDLQLSENDEVAQEFLRESHALDGHIVSANNAVEALIRKGKEALRTVEEITEGAKGKVLGVLELEEQGAGADGSDTEGESGEEVERSGEEEDPT